MYFIESHSDGVPRTIDNCGQHFMFDLEFGGRTTWGDGYYGSRYTASGAKKWDDDSTIAYLCVLPQYKVEYSDVPQEVDTLPPGVSGGAH